MIDLTNEIQQRIKLNSMAFGRFAHRVFSHTKVAVYKATCLSILLYGCESWIPYCRHIKALEAHYIRCLQNIHGTVTVTVTINGLVKLSAFNAHICPSKYLASFWKSLVAQENTYRNTRHGQRRVCWVSFTPETTPLAEPCHRSTFALQLPSPPPRRLLYDYRDPSVNQSCATLIKCSGNVTSQKLILNYWQLPENSGFLRAPLKSFKAASKQHCGRMPVNRLLSLKLQ